MSPTDPLEATSVGGIWASASRQKATVLEKDGDTKNAGPFVQVSRLGNPLVDPTYTPDGAAGTLLDGTANDVGFLMGFPYLGHPHEGYEHAHDP